MQRRTFWALAIPNMLAGAAEPIAGLVDTAFLGNLPDVTQLAAVALAILIFDYLYWGCSFLRLGTTGLTAQALGREDREEQALQLWRPVFMSLLLGCAVLLFQAPISEAAFALLDGDASVEAAGQEYFQARIWGAIPAFLFLTFWGWLLGQQRADYAMYMFFTLSGVNILLDYIFIIEMGMGAAGAGRATMIAEFAAATIGLVLIVKHWGGLPKLISSELLDMQAIKQLMNLNGSITVRTLTLITVIAAITNLSAIIGVVALASTAILHRFTVFLAMFLDGLANAVESLAGKAAGANNREDLKAYTDYAMRASLWIATLISLAIYVFAPQLLGLFTIHAPVLEQTIAILPLFLLAIIGGSMAFVYDGLFFGLAKAKPLMISVIAGTLVFIPIAWLARERGDLALLWFGFLMFMLVRAVWLEVVWQRYLAANSAPATAN